MNTHEKNLSALKKLISEHSLLHLPKHHRYSNTNDDSDDKWTELVDLDDGIVGLATSWIDGHKKRIDLTKTLNKLTAEVQDYTPKDEQDQKDKNIFIKYLSSLKKLNDQYILLLRLEETLSPDENNTDRLQNITFTEEIILPSKVSELLLITVNTTYSNTADLFRTIANQLKLEKNIESWESLKSNLKDLSWLKEKTIWIYHSNIPLDDVDNLNNYLDILLDCKQYWKQKSDHTLGVLFNIKDKAKIYSSCSK